MTCSVIFRYMEGALYADGGRSTVGPLPLRSLLMRNRSLPMMKENSKERLLKQLRNRRPGGYLARSRRLDAF